MILKDLDFDDWVSLCSFDRETKTLDFNDASALVNPVTRQRLVETGLTSNSGVLTDLGARVADAMLEKIAPFKKGVPFKDRPLKGLLGPDLKRISMSFNWTTWYHAVLKKKDCYTNGDILYFGPEPRRIKSVPTDGRKLTKVLNENIKNKTVPVEPYAYQIEEFGGMTVIWFRGEGDLAFPVQDSYFDFLTDRFKTGTFFASSDREAVQIRVKNKGFKGDVAALIMPVVRIKQPKL